MVLCLSIRLTIGDHIHAAVDAIADIDIKASWLTKERLVTGGEAAVTACGRVAPGLHPRFHHATPQLVPTVWRFTNLQPNQVRSDSFRWAAEEGVGLGWGMLGDGQGGYWDGFAG